MRHTKRFLKIFMALWVAIGLLVLGGLWRLAEGPLRLPVHFSKVRDLVRTYGIDFEEIYLFSPSLYSLPGVMVEKGKFENDTFHFQSHKIFLTWKLRTLLLQNGTWQIKQIRLEEPRLRFKKALSAESSTTFKIQDPLHLPAIQIKKASLENLPNGVVLPQNEMNLTLYQSGGAIKTHFYIDITPTEQKNVLEGSLLLKDKTLQGNIDFKNITPKDWAKLMPEATQPWADFYVHPTSGSLSFDGTLQNSWPMGTATLKVSAPFQGKESLKTITIENQIKFFQEDETNRITLQTKTEAFPWHALPQLWPSFLSPPVHHWCTKRIKGGDAHPIELHAEFSWNKESSSLSLKDLKGTLGVSDATVTYMDDMPVVEHAQADASFTHEKFLIHIPKGTTKNLKITKSQVRFEELHTDNPQGIVDLNIEGPLTEALWVADHPPLRFASQYDFDPKSVSGHSQTNLVLKFPTRSTSTMKTMDTTVTAKLKDFALNRIIMDQPVQFTEGNLDLKITRDLLSLGGDVNINGNASTLQWKESMGPNAKFLRRYNIKTPISIQNLLAFTPKTVQTIFKDTREFALEGETILNLDYMEKDSTQSLLVLNLDLKNSTLALPLFQYKKPKKEPGTAFLRLSFNKGSIEKIDGLQITAKDLTLKGSFLFHKDGTLDRILLKDSEVKKSFFEV